MTSRTGHHRRPPHRRPARPVAIGVALAILVGLVAPPAACASAASVRPARDATPAHRCACGMGCGSVCCCSKYKAPAPPPAPDDPKSKKDKAPAEKPGSCMRSAPCGGAVPPGGSTATAPIEKADRAARTPAPAPPLGSRRLAVPGSHRPGGRADLPLDEPPEPRRDA